MSSRKEALTVAFSPNQHKVQFASTVRVFRLVRFIRLAEGRFFGLFKTLGIDVIG